MVNNFEERCEGCGLMYPAKRLILTEKAGYLCIKCLGQLWKDLDDIIKNLTLGIIGEKENHDGTA